jgi:hypothetical protein
LLLLVIVLLLSSARSEAFIVCVGHLDVEFGLVLAFLQWGVVIVVLLLLLLLLHDIVLAELALVVDVVDHGLLIVAALPHLGHVEVAGVGRVLVLLLGSAV